MSLKGFFQRQVSRAAYLVERGLKGAEEITDEGGVLPKLPPKPRGPRPTPSRRKVKR